jgi:hypothetical protein
MLRIASTVMAVALAGAGVVTLGMGPARAAPATLALVPAAAGPPGLDPDAIPAEPAPSAAPSRDVVPAPLAAASPAPPAPTRPRFSFAVGFGTSFDHSGTSDGRTVTIPAFEVSLGAGDRALGFEANLMSTQASGRYRQVTNGKDDIGVDRAALDGLLALRPAWLIDRIGGRHLAPPTSYLARVWHSFTLDVGGTAERVAPGTESAYRLGGLLATHVDILPLTYADQASVLAIRIGARRVLAPKATLTSAEVTDTNLDLFVSLAAGF